MNTILDRISQIANNENISIGKLERVIGASKGVLSRAIANQSDIQSKWIISIVENYPQYSGDWLLTGNGSMILSEEKGKIPVYDVATIGGHNDVVAATGTSGHVAEWIDAGDWFPEATAAIHHYGDSMVEYPSGSILALKRVNDPTIIINGRNYVIETEDFRITKQLQDDGNDFIMAYSTNKETYPDGHLIHSPIRIPKASIRHIDMVLGCVTKEYSNGAIPIIKG